MHTSWLSRYRLIRSSSQRVCSSSIFFASCRKRAVTVSMIVSFTINAFMFFSFLVVRMVPVQM